VLGPVSTTDDKLFKAYIVEKEDVILADIAATEKKKQDKEEKQRKRLERVPPRQSIREQSSGSRAAW